MESVIADGYKITYYPENNNANGRNFIVNKIGLGTKFHNIKAKNHKQALSKFLKVPVSKIKMDNKYGQYSVQPGIFRDNTIYRERGNEIFYSINK